MDQLKKALQKAGFTTSDQMKTKERSRKAIQLDDERKGHEIRNQCEACDKFASNIECYEHRVGVLSGKKWLCLKCADEHRINDETRTTHQSPLARSGLFQREYGRTRKF